MRRRIGSHPFGVLLYNKGWWSKVASAMKFSPTLTGNHTRIQISNSKNFRWVVQEFKEPNVEHSVFLAGGQSLKVVICGVLETISKEDSAHDGGFSQMWWPKSGGYLQFPNHRLRESYGRERRIQKYRPQCRRCMISAILSKLYAMFKGPLCQRMPRPTQGPTKCFNCGGPHPVTSRDDPQNVNGPPSTSKTQKTRTLLPCRQTTAGFSYTNDVAQTIRNS